jgi:hypothetical protein
VGIEENLVRQILDLEHSNVMAEKSDGNDQGNELSAVLFDQLGQLDARG